MRFNNHDGGARKKEWTCVLENGKAIYLNTRTGKRHAIFLNKKGRPTYRNKAGIAMEAKDCPNEYLVLLKPENAPQDNMTVKGTSNKVKATKIPNKKIVLKKKTPPKAKTPTPKAKTSKLPNSFFGSPPKAKNPPKKKLIIGDYINKLEKGEPLPKNKTVRNLTKFCKLATRKNAFVYTTKQAIEPTPKPKTPTPKPKTPTPKPKTPTPKPKTPTPKPKTPTPKPKTPTPTLLPLRRWTPTKQKPKTKTPTPAKAKTPTPHKQPCGTKNDRRCDKGTKCNKKTGYCEPSGAKKTAKIIPNDSLQIMRIQDQELKEIGLKKSDFFEDVCLVLKNIRNKLHNSNNPNLEHQWNSTKLVKMHKLVPHTRDKKGKQMKGTNVTRDQYLGGNLIKIRNVLGKGGYGRIYGGTYGRRPCAIKESLEPMKFKSDIEEYYGEIIKQNELFCQAHRAKLSEPKYARIPKPLFIANMDKTPLLGMEPLDDSLYKFIKKSKKDGQAGDVFEYKIKNTKVITDMFECLCNTLIYLQDKYEFYHRDMHCGNIMYRKTGESYQWYLIDFGMSTFKLHDYRFSENGAGPYGKFNSDIISKGKAKGRAGHDLRLTLLFMFDLIEDNLEKMILPEAFNILKSMYSKIKSDIIINAIGSSSVFWHRGYKDAFDKLVTTETEPKNFLKDTIPKLREVITNFNKLVYKTKTKSPTKTKKEYVYVQRNK